MLAFKVIYIVCIIIFEQPVILQIIFRLIVIFNAFNWHVLQYFTDVLSLERGEGSVELLNY